MFFKKARQSLPYEKGDSMTIRMNICHLIGNHHIFITTQSRQWKARLLAEKFIKIIRFSSVVVAISMAAIHAVLAQDIFVERAEGENISLRELDLGQFSSALLRATTRLSSYEDLDKIPPHSLYNSIFVRILSGEEAYRHLFSNADWELMEALPSHQDASILIPQISSIRSTCFALNDRESLNLTFEQSLDLYVETARSTDLVLDNHYLYAYDLLSDSGKKIFNGFLEELRGTNNFVYSTTDFRAAALQFPEVASELMAARCEEISIIDLEKVSEGRTLQDDINISTWNGVQK